MKNRLGKKKIKGIENKNKNNFGIHATSATSSPWFAGRSPASAEMWNVKKEKSSKTSLAIRVSLVASLRCKEAWLRRGRRCVESKQQKKKNETHESQSSIPNPKTQTTIRRLCDVLLSLLLFDLEQQSAVDGWKHTTKGDGGTDKGVELLITADGELKVARGDALDLEILCGVAGKLEDFGRQVFEDGSDVHGGLCGDAHLVLRVRLEETLDTTAGELFRM